MHVIFKAVAAIHGAQVFDRFAIRANRRSLDQQQWRGLGDVEQLGFVFARRYCFDNPMRLAQ